MSLTGLPEALHVEVQGRLSAVGIRSLTSIMCSKQAIAEASCFLGAKMRLIGLS